MFRAVISGLGQTPLALNSLARPVLLIAGGLAFLFFFGRTCGLIPGSVDVPAGSPAAPAGQARTVAIHTLLPPDAIRSIDNPRFVAADEAEPQMNPHEFVMGLVIEGDARAYPIKILSAHEIVNDVVGGIPVAVSF